VPTLPSPTLPTHCAAQAFGFVSAPHTWTSRKDEGDKVIVVERGDLVMVFNFHPTNSYTDYRVGAYKAGPYKASAAAGGRGLRGAAC
jgi:hypothetical protein